MGVLEGKSAIVTGGAQGIGQAIVERFAREGAQVLLIDVNDARGEEVVENVRQAGGIAAYAHCDVSSESEVSAAVASAVTLFGGVDILVNNAALALYRLLHEYTPEEWDRVLAVDLKSIYLTARHCIPVMVQRGGSIVNIASVHARVTSTMNIPYVAAKGGIVSMTRAMCLECAPHNIRVNCVLPGAIATPMLLENWGDLGPDEHPLMRRIPLRRFGQPDEIARVVQFLASDESAYMTGSEILIDGGISAHFD